MTRRVLVVLCCTSALLAGLAHAHSGIPQAWWLDATAATRKLQARDGTGWVSGRCVGLAPRAVRAGSSVYKHFSCTVRRRANGITFTFGYRVHVVGPRGRISVGR